MNVSLRFILAAALAVFCLTAAQAARAGAALEQLAPAVTAEADAQYGDHGHSKVYWVYYRISVNSPWQIYGGYYSHVKAQAAVNYFRSRGYGSFYR